MLWTCLRRDRLRRLHPRKPNDFAVVSGTLPSCPPKCQGKATWAWRHPPSHKSGVIWGHSLPPLITLSISKGERWLCCSGMRDVHCSEDPQRHKIQIQGRTGSRYTGTRGILQERHPAPQRSNAYKSNSSKNDR